MKTLTSITLIALLLIFWGCSQDTVPTDPVLSDEDQIMSEILILLNLLNRLFKNQLFHFDLAGFVYIHW